MWSQSFFYFAVIQYSSHSISQWMGTDGVAEKKIFLLRANIKSLSRYSYWTSDIQPPRPPFLASFSLVKPRFTILLLLPVCGLNQFQLCTSAVSLSLFYTFQI